MNEDTASRLRNARSELVRLRHHLSRTLLRSDDLVGLDRGRVQRAIWDVEKALEELAWALPSQSARAKERRQIAEHTRNRMSDGA